MLNEYDFAKAKKNPYGQKRGDANQMSKRTNTAVWDTRRERWYIAVQKDGVRKFFYSSTPGRTGQREANAKADRWLDDGITVKASRVEDAGKLWLASVERTTSHTNYRPRESRWRVWALPVIGKKRITALTEQDLQDVIDRAYTAGLSRKTLQSLAGDMRSFCKYCRRAKLSTFLPEDIQIPAGARLKGKKVLQPDGLATLFAVDTTLYYQKRVPDPYIYAYRFQVLTGLRPGELMGLRWADVSGNTIQVSRSINIEGTQTQGKNENAVRAFALSDMARAVLDEQRKLTGDGDSVFCIRAEQHYYDRWRIYCRSNDIPPISVYELRHTFVSVAKTLPAGEVKELVGHSQNMDTFGQYSHALTGDAENTAQAVNAAFLKLLGNG